MGKMKYVPIGDFQHNLDKGVYTLLTASLSLLNGGHSCQKWFIIKHIIIKK
jgi:hypothetical protein